MVEYNIEGDNNMERLKELLLQKEQIYNEDLSEEEINFTIEHLDNIIVNEFTVEEIDQAEKELFN